jgi:hypothetical protein
MKINSDTKGQLSGDGGGIDFTREFCGMCRENYAMDNVTTQCCSYIQSHMEHNVWRRVEGGGQ